MAPGFEEIRVEPPTNFDLQEEILVLTAIKELEAMEDTATIVGNLRVGLLLLRLQVRRPRRCIIH